MNLLTKQKETHKLRQQTYGCQGEGWGKEIVRAFGMNTHTLLYFKWIHHLLYSTWNSAQCYMAGWMGRAVCGRMATCICMAESLLCSPETITTS